MDKRIFMLLGAIIIIGGIVLLLQRLLKPATNECPEVVMSVSSGEIFEGDSISFEDRTEGATEWRWDFDNGDTSSMPSGKYSYTNAGTYQIRLKINNGCEDTFRVEVKSAYVEATEKIAVTISGPETVYVGQKNTWKGSAPGASEWKWKFGENGIVDVTTQEAEYTYKYPGKNIKIVLQTDVSRLPGEKYVNVLPKPNIVPDGGGGSVILKHVAPSNEDIKTRLNNISVRGYPTNEDTKWISENFAGFIKARVNWNIKSVRIDNLEDLFDEFASNKNHYDITTVQPEIDSKTQMISSLSIKAQEKVK